jgi:hypothetical protein
MHAGCCCSRVDGKRRIPERRNAPKRRRLLRRFLHHCLMCLYRCDGCDHDVAVGLTHQVRCPDGRSGWRLSWGKEAKAKSDLWGKKRGYGPPKVRGTWGNRASDCKEHCDPAARRRQTKSTLPARQGEEAEPAEKVGLFPIPSFPTPPWPHHSLPFIKWILHISILVASTKQRALIISNKPLCLDFLGPSGWYNPNQPANLQHGSGRSTLAEPAAAAALWRQRQRCA